MVGLDEVSAGYDGRSVIFEDVTIAVPRAGRVALLGVSGSGKTTMLRVMGGQLAARAGRAELLGCDLSTAAESKILELRRNYVGHVFQTPQLLTELDARDNVALPLRLLGVDRRVARRKADDLLEHLGLGGVGRSEVSRLSGGQQQRVSVARAVVHAPLLVLADEPTASLDRANAELVLDTLETAVHAVRGALVLATHDVRAAERCRERYRLDAGHLEAIE